MSAPEALRAAQAAGVRVIVDDGDLVLGADAPPPAPILEALKRYKTEIVALLGSGSDGWSADDWRAFFDECAGVSEFDGGLSRVDAKARAFEAAVVHWMNCNPPTDPGPDRCAGCGGPVGHIGRDSVPVIRGNGEHVWVHHRCHHRLMARRYAEAVKALAAMGLTPPTGWRARGQTEQKAHIARVRVVHKRRARNVEL